MSKSHIVGNLMYWLNLYFSEQYHNSVITIRGVATIYEIMHLTAHFKPKIWDSECFLMTRLDKQNF